MLIKSYAPPGLYWPVGMPVRTTVGMYGYSVPDPGPYIYKCVYSGGKEIRIISDQSSATFVKCEKKSPDLKEVWKLIKSDDAEDWEKIYPEAKSKYGYY